MSIDNFISRLIDFRGDHVFNPYADTCPIYDRLNASQLRMETLMSILNAAINVEIDAIWVGRDLGYRGGRRTGLALTDDVHFDMHAKRWNVCVSRPTHGQVVAERTASVVWKLLAPMQMNIFLWNAFPYHPHLPGKLLSNRPHTKQERRYGEELLNMLLELLAPRQIVAIGNDAFSSVENLSYPGRIIKVRHPSYGGQRDFIEQIKRCHS